MNFNFFDFHSIQPAELAGPADLTEFAQLGVLSFIMFLQLSLTFEKKKTRFDTHTHHASNFEQVQFLPFFDILLFFGPKSGPNFTPNDILAFFGNSL